MDITVTISSRAEEFLGPDRATIEAKVRDLAEKEAVRLWHIQRSQPKNRVLAVSPEAQKIGDSLLAIYAKKRERFGDSYPERFVQQEAAIRAAMATGDIQALKAYLVAQLWLERQ